MGRDPLLDLGATAFPPGAQTLFEECYDKNPEDEIALFYVERCQRILRSIMGRN